MGTLSEALAGAHALWRYVVLISAFIAIGNMLMGALDKRSWKASDTRIGRFFITALDLEVVLGVLLWLLQERWGGADVLRSWRHPALMVLALVIAHYGWWRAARMPGDRSRFALLTMYFVIAGVVIVVGVLQIQGVF